MSTVLILVSTKFTSTSVSIGLYVDVEMAQINYNMKSLDICMGMGYLGAHTPHIWLSFEH